MVYRAKADIQDIGGGKSEIIVTELPYQVKKLPFWNELPLAEISSPA